MAKKLGNIFPTLFKTAKQKVLDAYAAAGQPFEAGTQPYHSVGTVVFDLVDPVGPTNSFLHAVMREQTIEWFGYGLADQNIPSGNPNQARRVTEGLTNLTDGRNTNGSEDYIIEALTCGTYGGMRIAYPDEFSAGISDKTVQGAYRGTTMLYDPGSVVCVPQMMAPYNLEDVFFQAARSHIALTLEFDRKKAQHIGTLANLFEGSGRSYLRTNGAPDPSARYTIPEGKIWRAKGNPDSDMVMLGRVVEPVVIPVNNLDQLRGTPRSNAVMPLRILLDIKMVMHGVSMQQPSKN